MNWQELRKEADNLPVYERLLLVEAIIRSLSNELRPKEPIPEGVVERLRGVLKTDEPTPTDEEIEAMKYERLSEKYLK
ncbi:hypothetical protein [Limnoraphis robusta]|uniref:Uncharacterized protein n=1 Tax=Limnoraphis robusta CS-951 TaxID=1637645 RepID=A0A0F5YDK5_9CYAN|nr:hypothetical protein [Limnoraphis robusta]KKD36707.1 hypothetical protein WN50_18350 [Limnoraphis robusta CS-951]